VEVDDEDTRPPALIDDLMTLYIFFHLVFDRIQAPYIRIITDILPTGEQLPAIKRQNHASDLLSTQACIRKRIVQRYGHHESPERGEGARMALGMGTLASRYYGSGIGNGRTGGRGKGYEFPSLLLVGWFGSGRFHCLLLG
jgi:hypothetical protein